MTIEDLQASWRDLNSRYFSNSLPPIDIVWSRRLTASAGLFVSHGGPRTMKFMGLRPRRRVIRLSAPLLEGQTPHDRRELIATLAHEMIHQWQFDILKRHPTHGPDFHKKMEELNRDGLGITIRHDLTEAVRRWVKYAWRCLGCGRLYERQRRTIRPGHHRCGACHGKLREVPHEGLKGMPAAGSRRRGANEGPQLALDLWMP